MIPMQFWKAEKSIDFHPKPQYSTHEAAVLDIFLKPKVPKLIHDLCTQEEAVPKYC